MTEKQKKTIRELRQQRWGYRRIARALQIPRDAVKQFCVENGLAGSCDLIPLNLSVLYENIGVCRTCGKELEQKPRGRKRHFCSGKCRTAYCRELKKVGGDDHEQSILFVIILKTPNSIRFLVLI